MRRGRIFYFRKRLPRTGSNREPNLFLCLSLRTDLPLDAVKRAAALLTVYEQEEDKIVDALNSGTLTATDIKIILTEMMRTRLAQFLDLQSAPVAQTDAEIETRIEELEAENKSLRRAARRADWGNVRELIAVAARSMGLEMPAEIDGDLGRSALSMRKRLNEVEIQIVDGEDVRRSARPLLDEHGIDDFDRFIAAPVGVDAAFAEVDRRYPSKEMKRITAALKVAYVEFFRNTPPHAIGQSRQEEFLKWVARFPKNHGKKHGKNAWTNKKEVNGEGPQGKTISKTEEIAAADAHDYLAMEEIRAMEDISLAEKRARLAEQLQPRITTNTLRKYRDSLSRLFRVARALGSAVPQVISYEELDRLVQSLATDDELYVRVTKPKIRLPWSKERLAAFLTSPLFTGSASEHRRWKSGRIVVRDASYWVPLLVLTLGSRITEILHLKKSDVVRRDGELCLTLNWGPEAPGKTTSARRILPLPRLLLELGFAGWFQNLPEEQMMLFPEALARSKKGDVVSAFGKHLRGILGHLGLADYEEDFYASRKTLSSMLDQAGIQEGRRQAIAGHAGGTVLNCHYTAHEVEQLKSALDEADFQLEIRHNPKLGFPVIRKCNLGKRTQRDVEVTLAADGQAATVAVLDKDDPHPVFEYALDDKNDTMARGEAARALVSIAKDCALRMPRNSEKRKALEHLMAYA
ncbi:integrase [Sagittula salina]|nr:integrase [Sagittula salina]